MIKGLYPLIPLAFIPTLTLAQTAVGTLQGNDVQMGILSNGLIGADAPVLVPAASGVSPLYSAGLWLGGLDANSQLKLAAHMYGSGGHDFYPGPLTTDGSATISAETMALYDQTWIVNGADITTHVAYFNCMNDPDCDVGAEFPDGYEIPTGFLYWPAEGDTQNGQALYLAPFVDASNDGFYDPTSGDHPCTPGDQALFMIFNDKGGAHIESGADPLGVEVHMTAFAYNDEPHLDQTVFVHYKIINRSSETYSDFRITSFADMDIGCSDDDFIGTDVQRNMVYTYNWDDIDQDCLGVPGYGEQPPAFGVMVLKGPLMDADGTDDQNDDLLPAYTGSGFGDGVIDNERHGLSNSMLFKREGPSEITSPSNAAQFYGYMNNQWKNGVPLTYGGSGYSEDPEAVQAMFAYPGATDPVGAGTNGEPQPVWQEEVPGLPIDRKALATMGPITLEPGEEQDILVAFVYARAADGGASASVLALQQRADSVHAFAQTIPGIMAGGSPCDAAMNVGLTEQLAARTSLQLFPNPAQDQLTLVLEGNDGSDMLRVFDARGAQVLQQRLNGRSTTIDISRLQAGLYQVQYGHGKGSSAGRFVKE